MHMALERRLQVLLDEERFQRISTLARERGVAVAVIVREAIDRGLPRPEARRAAAGAAVLAAAPMPAPAVDDLVAELDLLRRRGL
jgi:hypothetical protein